MFGDFGLAGIKPTAEAALYTECGTRGYMAPEMYHAPYAKGYNGLIADLWSMGVILFQLLLGHLPFNGALFPSLNRLSGHSTSPVHMSTPYCHTARSTSMLTHAGKQINLTHFMQLTLIPDPDA